MMVGLAFGLRLVVFFVNGSGVQIVGLEDLIAIEATHIIDAVPSVEEFGSLVLTTLHSEIFPILVSNE
jgi:hypothetical protein